MPHARPRARSRLAPGLLAVALLFSVGHRALAEAVGGGPDEITIAATAVEGLPEEARLPLLRQLTIQPGSSMTPEQYQTMRDEDIQKLELLGYRVQRVLEAPLADGRLRLTFVVEERLLVSSILFTGTTGISESRLRKELLSRLGARYDAGAAVFDERALEELFRRRGWPSCKVRHEFRRRPDERGGLLVFQVERGLKVRPSPVRFTGNDSFDAADLRRQIQTGRSGLGRQRRFVQEVFEEDLRRLVLFYRECGWLDARIEPELADETVKAKSDAAYIRRRIVLHVTEGPRYRVGRLRFEGNTVFSDQELLAAINQDRHRRERPLLFAQRLGRLVPGSVWGDRARQLDASAVQKLYGRVGRVDTAVEVRAAPAAEPGLVDVTIEVLHEGEVMRLGQVLFRSDPPTRTRERVLLREMKLHPGDLCDPEKVVETITRWARLGYLDPRSFDNQHLALVDGALPGTKDLVVDLVEQLTGAIMVSASTSSSEMVAGEISLRQRNFDYRDLPKSWNDFITGNAFVGAGQNFELKAHIGLRLVEYSARFTEPWLFDRPLALDLEAHDRTEYKPTYNVRGPGGSLGLAPRFGDHFSVGLSYAYNDLRISDVDPAAPPAILEEAGEYQVGSLTLSARWNSIRRDPFQPLSTDAAGWSASLSARLAARALGSNREFFNLQGNLEGFWTLARNRKREPIILSAYGRAAWTRGFGGSTRPPAFERLFVGGPTGGWGLRGFDNQSLSPTELNGSGIPVEVGGGFALVGGAELTFPLYTEEFQSFALRGCLYYQTGNAWWQPGDFDPDELRHSVGLGLTFAIPKAHIALQLFYSRPFGRMPEDDLQRFQFAVAGYF